MKKNYFSMILAMTPEGGIGYKNSLPVKIQRDMKFFSKVTQNSSVIMGKNTWLSMNQKPLKNRYNIVVSQSLKPQEGMTLAGSLNEALQLASTQNKNIFVIGGKKLYEEGAHHESCKEVYLTRIGAKKKCDVFVDKTVFKNFSVAQTSKTIGENDTNYDFQRLIRPGAHQDSFITTKHEEYQYLDLIDHIIKQGVSKGDRTGTGIITTFGNMMRFSLNDSFPLLTTKKVFFRGVVEELLWFLKGETNGLKLLDKNIKIWEGNGTREYLDKIGLKEREEHDLGPIYGFQWRHFGAKYETMHSNYEGKGVDQLKFIIDQISKNPNSRRIIMSAWNPTDMDQMALPPCHVLSQFQVANGKLNCLMYQRSCDVGLGVPFNIASYALLTCILSEICNLERGEFVHVLGDTHIYQNHLEQLKQQLTRVPYPFPLLKIINKRTKIEDYKYEDFQLIGYQTHDTIKMKMAV